MLRFFKTFRYIFFRLQLPSPSRFQNPLPSPKSAPLSVSSFRLQKNAAPIPNALES